MSNCTEAQAALLQGGFFYVMKVCKLLRVSDSEEAVSDSANCPFVICPLLLFDMSPSSSCRLFNWQVFSAGYFELPM
jgi:hypothetical protein